MVRPNDQFWNHVDKMDGGRCKCKYCEFVFGNGTSVSRIKSHLSGVRGLGISICTKVPESVQEAAYQAIQEGSYKRLRTMPSSSNNGIPHSMVSLLQDHTTEDENLVSGEGGRQMEVLGVEPEMREVESVSGTEVETMMPPVAMEPQAINRVHCESLLRDEEVWTGEMSLCPQVAEHAENMTGELVPHATEVGCHDEHIADAAKTTQDPLVDQVLGLSWAETLLLSENGGEEDMGNGDAFPTEKLVGEAFKTTMENIWTSLKRESIASIGIYGMGGVGKTTLVTHLYNRLCESKEFGRVIWVTVSQNLSISHLQNIIAANLGLDLSKEQDERKRAAKLSIELTKRQNCVLIFDDLWKDFPAKTVGIPVRVNGCKLLLTTRSLEVCRKMGCKESIKLMPLCEKDGWTLFIQRLGHVVRLSRQVKEIAKSVVAECAGLPLAIMAVAGSLRGVDDISEWTNTLNKLQESKFGHEMEEEVFRILRHSYSSLDNLALKRCFLYCALYPEDTSIERSDLIEHLIAEEIMEESESRRAQFDEGHSMLNKLERVCLLEGFTQEGIKYVKMHDVIRDMALLILRENSLTMVQAGMQLDRIPDEEKWTKDLMAVSLINNSINEIPYGHSPRCPNLTTLLLFNNCRLRLVAGSFFKHLSALKVLDLSFTSIVELPSSISDLVSLRALSLRRCLNLRRVPPLAALQELRKLDVSCTKLKGVPQGVELLSNLRYLNLYGTELKKLPAGILPKLQNLQFLNLSCRLEVGEVISLRKLESVKCLIYDVEKFRLYMKGLKKQQMPNTYDILVTEDADGIWFIGRYRVKLRRKIALHSCSIGVGDNLLAFLEGVKELEFCGCHDMTSLANCSPLNWTVDLEYISISRCQAVQCLFPISPLSTVWTTGSFSHLKGVYICACPNMEELFPSALLSNLRNLEVIDISWCEKMKILCKDGSNGTSSKGPVKFNLPKLRILALTGLPKLKSICSAQLVCNSLEEITVWRCPKLKRMPIYLPLLDNGLPFPPPSLAEIKIRPQEWWESVKWDQPEAKDVLLPLCHFE